MKKVMFTLVLALLFVFNNAIGQEYAKGTSVLNVGLGVGGFNGPSLSASFEVGAFPIGDDFGVIGLGALAGFRTYTQLFSGTSDYRYNTLAFGPRGTFHFTVIPVEKLDVYAAVQILLRHHSVKFDGQTIGDSDLDLGSNFVAGARYYFAEKMSVFGEVGYGLSYLTAGISFKF